MFAPEVNPYLLHCNNNRRVQIITFVPVNPVADWGFLESSCRSRPAQPVGGRLGVSCRLGAYASVHMAYGNEGTKSISQASVKGKVKWFNATKGFGFITMDNGGDAFCHASALQATGHSDVQPGTTIVCDLADSQRGLQVVAVHSVDTSTAEAPSARSAPRQLWRRRRPLWWRRSFRRRWRLWRWWRLWRRRLWWWRIAMTAMPRPVPWSKARSSSSTTRRGSAL